MNKPILTLMLCGTGLLSACAPDALPPTAKQANIEHTPSITTALPLSSFNVISDTDWNETAVRKVLHAFAYGGFATDSQITNWANARPEDAIYEMLTVSPVNERLSPVQSLDNLDRYQGTLSTMSQLWHSSSSFNFSTNTGDFAEDQWGAPEATWLAAVNKRGLNPVRQKIGLFETNYHLAANQDVGVTSPQMIKYYDDIMNDIHNGESYQQVLAGAASSAAIAVQYNHRENIFRNGTFEGNEDFAREYHQLFFGILGDDYDDSNDTNEIFHEEYNIQRTAHVLTDMEVVDEQVHFGTNNHYTESLDILGSSIAGGTAKQKIEALAEVAITNQESLNNLPIIIVGTLADDNLTEENTNKIRAIWAALDDKEILTFLRAYAISDAFHSVDRIKFQNSINRNVTVSNLLTLTNEESYARYYDPESQIHDEGVTLFRPLHNVFGGQTGLEASNSANIFNDAYYQSTNDYNFFARSYSGDWNKDWGAIAPKTGDNYVVANVAEWLWQRFVADGLKNFSNLERAQVYALLATGSDYGYYKDSSNPEIVYDLASVTDDELAILAGATLALDSTNQTDKRTANQNIGLAIAFIAATPYIFAQEGK